MYLFCFTHFTIQVWLASVVSGDISWSSATRVIMSCMLSCHQFCVSLSHGLAFGWIQGSDWSNTNLWWSPILSSEFPQFKFPPVHFPRSASKSRIPHVQFTSIFSKIPYVQFPQFLAKFPILNFPHIFSKIPFNGYHPQYYWIKLFYGDHPFWV